MSNEISIPGLSSAPAAVFRSEGHREVVAEDMGLGYSVVGVDGKSFVLKHAGQRHVLKNKEGFPFPHFDFILLRSPPRPSNFFYKNGFEQGSHKAPDCTSTDGIAPDDNVMNKQNDLCQTCPRYEWKTNLPGRPKGGRECQQRMRVAILPHPEQIKAALGIAFNEPVLLNVPAASIRNLVELDRQMGAKWGGDAPYYSYVTRATFDPNYGTPRLQFVNAGFLQGDGDSLGMAVKAMREDALAYRIIGQKPDGTPLMRAQGAIGAPRPVTQISAPVAPRAEPKPAVVYHDDDLEDTLRATIEAQPANVVPIKKEEPKAAPAKVVEAAPDIDDIVAQMVAATRPRPPGA